MALDDSKRALSRRDLFTGALLRNLCAPAATASVGVTAAGRFATALGSLFPEPIVAPATISVPVRCPW